MLDVARDNRVVSMAAKVGLKNNLVTMLDQLQRCQKSLNEFLEVRKAAAITLYVCATFLQSCFLSFAHSVRIRLLTTMSFMTPNYDLLSFIIT